VAIPILSLLLEDDRMSTQLCSVHIEGDKMKSPLMVRMAVLDLMDAEFGCRVGSGAE
jgi:hypothetical protein